VQGFENKIPSTGQSSTTHTKEEAWHKINKELEGFGITPDVLETHRNLIVGTLKDAALSNRKAATGGRGFAVNLLSLFGVTVFASRANVLLLTDFFMTASSRQAINHQTIKNSVTPSESSKRHKEVKQSKLSSFMGVSSFHLALGATTVSQWVMNTVAGSRR
jgi:hypothetical protein